MNRWQNEQTNAVVYVDENRGGPACIKCTLEAYAANSKDDGSCEEEDFRRGTLTLLSYTIAVCPRCKSRWRLLKED